VHDLFRQALQEAGLEDVHSEVWMTAEPSYTSPDAEIVRLTQANAEAVTGSCPRLQMAYGGTDCRFFRYRGVSAAIYGPRVYNMGAPNEMITVDDFFTVLKVHAGTILEYLGAGDS
ncbi:MAG: M20/M25/M40 family metallo-hydrolase, partial [Armatimonadota bacterium]|nr:M20/M25/M40 family metallo-hydrolase [Armatimonadota bacterium]